MLSINSGPAVAWPTAAPVTVAPVSAVTAIAPAQRSSGDGNAGLDSGRRGQTQNGGAPAADAPEAAPLLPRERTDGGREQASAETADAAAKAEQHERAQDKAEEKAAKLKLQEVLANVWKASAAVVDAVLGRDGAGPAPAQGDDPARSAPDPSLVAAAQPLPGEVLQADSVSDLRDTQDVVAYDERGASSLAPPESGSLVNQRV
ncbi:hypothetical protein KIH07_24190 [Hydrogenophaga taeniospiralis]|uniref:hypothetical protein n=1 Tax=Hydrogenophaga taeniospiralis TaxID=65656 RepID=UPI001CFB4286|nr:hypothetical protein [Hydrogenophaga taeniospiralis]MCB4366849.1 hypothetical protein [Hydrogenophaga taeniospiralis]